MKTNHILRIALALVMPVLALNARGQNQQPQQSSSDKPATGDINAPQPPPPEGPPQGGDQNGGGAPLPRQGHHHRIPLIVQALDTNHDGVIDADEIANAGKALWTLDKRGDGRLTPDEFMGPPPPRPGDERQNTESKNDGSPHQKKGGPAGNQNTKTASQTGEQRQPPAGNGGNDQPPPPPPPPDEQQGGPQTNQHSSNSGGPRHRHPPFPALVQAIDTNHDGVIDADEIANASKALMTLDRKGDGKLTWDEYMGPPPPRPPDDQPPDNNSNGPGAGNAQPGTGKAQARPSLREAGPGNEAPQ
jgi:hypothetical protein